jgi:hypothetical protein
MLKDQIALVVGNGESRKGLDLENYCDYTIIGCNALHRDYRVDHLVCCDQRMVREALDNDSVYSIYTRERYYRDFKKLQKIKTVKLLPGLPYQGKFKADMAEHWGSGPYAVLLACSLGFRNIKIIGFDLYGKEHKINNVYKGTTHYLKESSNAVDPSFWIYQIKQIFYHYPDVNFEIYNNKDWSCPESWLQSNVKNFEIKNLEIACESVKYPV